MLGRGRRLLSAALFGLVCVSCTSGSGTISSTSPLASDQTLRFPIQGELKSLDPAMIDTEQESQIAHNLFDGLLKFDNNLNVVPDIAASLPTVSADGLTYNFKLRDDVTFWNGDKVSSQDVLYSWNRAVAMQGPYASNLFLIAGYDKVAANQASGAKLESLLDKKDPAVTMEGLSAPSDYTLQVTLTSAAGWFEAAIAQPASVASVVDQKVVKDDFDNWWDRPETLVGTGAFKMSGHSANESVDFVALPNWWGRPQPTLRSVHLDVVADAQAAIGKYDQGGSDLYGYADDTPAMADVVRIQSDASHKGQVFLTVTNKTYWVTFNLVADASRQAGGPFTLDQGQASHDLREAFALSVDRAKLAKDLCADVLCAPATAGLIPRGLLGHLGEGSDPLAGYDPFKAKSLLVKGDPGGTKTRGLVYTYDPENKLNEPTARFLQSEWQANLGVAVELRAVPHSTFIANRLKGAYVLSRDGWTASYNHPQDWFDYLWGTGAGCPDSSCSSGYATKAYDQLLAKADAEPLGSAASDYRALNLQLINDVAYIPLYYAVRPLLIKPYVLGAGANNLFDWYWNQIQIVEH